MGIGSVSPSVADQLKALDVPVPSGVQGQKNLLTYLLEGNKVASLDPEKRKTEYLRMHEKYSGQVVSLYGHDESLATVVYVGVRRRGAIDREYMAYAKQKVKRDPIPEMFYLCVRYENGSSGVIDLRHASLK